MAALLATIKLIPLATATVQSEDLQCFKTGFCKRAAPTFRAKKFDDIGDELLSMKILKTGKRPAFPGLYTVFSQFNVGKFFASH